MRFRTVRCGDLVRLGSAARMPVDEVIAGIALSVSVGRKFAFVSRGGPPCPDRLKGSPSPRKWVATQVQQAEE